MQLFKILEDAISRFADNNAFCIDNNYFTYRELAGNIAGIRNELRTKGQQHGKNIGLVTHDDLATYAAILAIWFEGGCYVPISPQMPPGRNEEIIRLAAIDLLIDSSEQPLFPGHPVIASKNLVAATPDRPAETGGEDQLAYIVFTSGSTGIPKGVPVTAGNLSTFVDSFLRLGLALNENDRWLQMFELTFDLSVMSYLVPLLQGACVFTIPKNQIKYNYIFRLLDENELTVALMVPGILHYLRPYFEEINCPHMKYNLFCGEALSLDTTEAWSHCIPNAEILNVYGPSEATIFCSHYLFRRANPNKTQNGVLSIGKPMQETYMIIADAENRRLKPGETGELCLAGKQLTPGYLNDEGRNKQAFFQLEYNGKPERFYRTGDLCIMDEEGDVLYIGRTDSQVKIQGYRVELPEIEFYSKAFLEKKNVLALAFTNSTGGREIGLVIEGAPFDTSLLTGYLKLKIPYYMVPTRIRFEPEFPLNNNGKTDRKELLKKLQES